MVGKTPSLVAANVTAGTVLKNVYTKTSAGDVLTFPEMIDNGVNASGFVLSGWSHWSGYKRDGAAYIMEVSNPTGATYPWELTVRYNNPGIKFGTGSATRFTDCTVYAAWFHWTIVVSDKRKFEYYINGVLKGTKTVDNNKYVDNATDIHYQVGGTAGYTDEIRILNELPSDGWVKAEYDSIKNTNFIVASAAVNNGNGFLVIVR